MPLLIVATGVGDDQFNDVAFHGSGALAVIGSFASTIAIGGESVTTTATMMSDMMVAVIEPDGTTRWLRGAGATGIGSGANIGWLGDTVIAGGYFLGTAAQLGNASSGPGQDAVVVRYAASGLFQSAAHWGSTTSSNVQLRGLKVITDRLVFGGIYAGIVDFGAGPLPATAADNAFLVATALDGSMVDSRALNGGMPVFINDVAVAPDGTICVAGWFQGTTDLGGGPVTATGTSAFVASYDRNLGYRWARTFGSSAIAEHITSATNGDCIAAGTWMGSLTIDGHIATSAGGRDGWVMRFGTASGTVAWLTKFASAADEQAYGIVILSNDRIGLAGKFSDAAIIAGRPVQSDGPSDAFFAVIGGTGTLDHLDIIGGAGDVSSFLGGMDVNAESTAVAIAFGFSGELRVGGLRSMAVNVDGAVAVLPVPQ